MEPTEAQLMRVYQATEPPLQRRLPKTEWTHLASLVSQMSDRLHPQAGGGHRRGAFGHWRAGYQGMPPEASASLFRQSDPSSAQ